MATTGLVWTSKKVFTRQAKVPTSSTLTNKRSVSKASLKNTQSLKFREEVVCERLRKAGLSGLKYKVSELIQFWDKTVEVLVGPSQFFQEVKKILLELVKQSEDDKQLFLEKYTLTKLVKNLESEQQQHALLEKKHKKLSIENVRLIKLVEESQKKVLQWENLIQTSGKTAHTMSVADLFTQINDQAQTIGQLYQTVEELREREARLVRLVKLNRHSTMSDSLRNKDSLLFKAEERRLGSEFNLGDGLELEAIKSDSKSSYSYQSADLESIDP